MKFTDITPAQFMCHSNDCCPAVLETETSYVIIGKKLSAEALAAVEGRVGDDEYVIEVQKGMIDDLRAAA